MPENKGGGIPKTVKIGEVEYVIADHPELAALIQAGRKDEKDKLYATIKDNEAKIKVLEDEKKSLGTLSQADKDALKKAQDELAVAKADLEKVQKDDDKKDGKDKDKKPETGLTAEQVQKMVADALKTQAEAHQTQLEAVQGNLTKKEVSDYREKMLAENKGLLIEGLVPTTLGSKEEVNKAIADALVASKDYIRKEYEVEDGKKEQLTLAEIEKLEAKKAETPPPPAGGGTWTPNPNGGTPPPPPTGGGDLTGKELVKNLKNMSQDEFNKNRDAIKQEILKVGYGEA